MRINASRNGCSGYLHRWLSCAKVSLAGRRSAVVDRCSQGDRMESMQLKPPVGLLQSGGLSSLAVAVWLAEQSIPSHQFVAHIGQSTQADIDRLVVSLQRSGAGVTVVDLRDRMAEVAADLLRYYARHDGGYWNTTGAARYVLVSELAPQLHAEGYGTLAHGCVGGGNDERRFARYTVTHAPELEVYAPWADPKALARFPDRAAMAKAVVDHDLYLDVGSGVDRSTDANVAGISHESAELEDLTVPATRLQPRWSRWPADAAAGPELVTVTFAAGRVIDVNGSGPRPLDWMTVSNDLGARQGIWLRDVVERRIIGTVCRGVYEAPGLEVLDRAWTKMLEVSLDAERRALYDQLARVCGAAMYSARWIDRSAASARSAIDQLVADVTGRVSLAVHRGVITVTGVEAASELVQQTRFGSGGNRWN
ncbi:MAG: argininosuccinate synthase domain-containing protein [Micromonosporaceae bacterium]